MRRELHAPTAPVATMRRRLRHARSANHRRHAGDRAALAGATAAGALLWLLVGCCGLLWTIAFTSDAQSMTIGLAVWVFCFVAPSTLATVLAYRWDEQSLPGGTHTGRGRIATVSAGD